MISIIIPCYNVAQYIEKCIESIISQSKQDYEIIVINDGSSDNILEILNKYINNPKIRVFSFENQGVAQARNEGILRANGEYILFVDPDDYIEPNTLEVLYKESQKDDFDAVRFGFKKIYVDQNYISHDDKEECKLFISNDDIVENYLPSYIGIGQKDLDEWKKIDSIWKRKQFASVCRFMFKRKILIDNNILFKKGISLGEDKFFICLFFLYANKISVIDSVLYNYLIREKGGMTSSVKNPSKIANDKIIGVTERGYLNELYQKRKNIDIYNLYIGTIIFGILEIIYRSKDLKPKDSIEILKKYLSLSDVKKAAKIVHISRLPFKLYIPMKLIKMNLYYEMIYGLYIINKLHIKVNILFSALTRLLRKFTFAL